MIKAQLKNTTKQIKYKRTLATLSNFEEMIKQVPMVLHISCHGIKNNIESFRYNYDEIKSQGDFLLFETHEGMGELVSCKQLK